MRRLLYSLLILSLAAVGGCTKKITPVVQLASPLDDRGNVVETQYMIPVENQDLNLPSSVTENEEKTLEVIIPPSDTETHVFITPKKKSITKRVTDAIAPPGKPKDYDVVSDKKDIKAVQDKKIAWERWTALSAVFLAIIAILVKKFFSMSWWSSVVNLFTRYFR